MPAVCRLGDQCTGHGAFPARPNAAGSGDVLINGIPAHRQGDGWEAHCSPSSCHGGATAEGSATVFVNGQPLARIGDAVDCGSTVAQGSPDVFAG